MESKLISSGPKIVCEHCNDLCLQTESRYFKSEDIWLCKNCTLEAVTKIATERGHNVRRIIHHHKDANSCILQPDLQCSLCDAQFTAGSGIDGTLLTSSECHISYKRGKACPNCGTLVL